METRICARCGEEKELHENFRFYGGYWTTRCRTCLVELHREYNRKNREIINAKSRIYNARPEVKKHKSEYGKRYRLENAERKKEKDLLYRKSARGKEIQRQYYQNNKEKIKEKSYRYYIENKENITERERKRRQTDNVYRLKNIVRKSIRHALDYRSFKKSKRTEEITKLRIDKLKEYLLNTFKDRYGYEWDGKEKVEVDHIIPLVTADTEEKVMELCYYTNLQLLRQKDNAEKGVKIGEYLCTKDV